VSVCIGNGYAGYDKVFAKHICAQTRARTLQHSCLEPFAVFSQGWTVFSFTVGLHHNHGAVVPALERLEEASASEHAPKDNSFALCLDLGQL